IAARDQGHHVVQFAGPLVVWGLIHGLDVQVSLGARFLEMLSREVRWIFALTGLHRLVFLALRSPRLVLPVDFFLDMQPASDDSVGVRFEMLLGFFHHSPHLMPKCSGLAKLMFVR